MNQVNIQELEAKLTKLRTHRAQSQELGLPTDTIDARIAELASQLNAAQISISGSPRTQQIIGNDNVQIYIDQYIGKDSDSARAARTMFDKYLSDIWGPLIRLPMMVIAERKTGDKEIPLTAVYTELNVTAMVGVGKQKGLMPSGGQAGIQGLQGDPEQLKRIQTRVGREAEEAKEADDETYSRQVTALVLAETADGNTTRFVHGPRGLERQQNPNGDWVFPVRDGLGSVRGMVDNQWPELAVQGTRQYAPYGVPFGAEGTMNTPFGFTGEQTDGNELVYLRARYLNPALGVFASVDPWEGDVRRAMSLNSYLWVEGNPVLMRDPSGKNIFCGTPLQQQQTCRELCVPPGVTLGQLPDSPYFQCYLECVREQGGLQPLSIVPLDPCAQVRGDESIKSKILNTFSGTATLNPSDYIWWSGSISNVKVTYYGSRALRDQTVTDPSQLSSQEAWDICCGQGSVSIGDRGYRCDLGEADRTTLCSSPVPADFQPPWAQNDRCGNHPILSNETCAVPGETGAVKLITGIAGEKIGNMFAFIIPASGDYSQGVAIYLNDAGAGNEFENRQIDIYAGVLDENSQPTTEGVWLDIYNTPGNMVCLLASSATLAEYSPPK